MNVNDATRKWVSQFDSYPKDMIEILMDARWEEWSEVTTPRKCDKVHVDLPLTCNKGEIEDIYEDGKYHIKLDNGSYIDAEKDDIEVKNDSRLPMWGTMWSFKNPCDEYWMESYDGIKKMSECGFRVYRNEDWGYFFGIDGAGYDFYDAHWIPAYKARGLRWHDEVDEEQKEE